MLGSLGVGHDRPGARAREGGRCRGIVGSGGERIGRGAPGSQYAADRDRDEAGPEAQ